MTEISVPSGSENGRAGTGGLPPGPALAPVLQALLWTLTPGPFVRFCSARHGDIFTVTFPGSTSLVTVADPAAIKTLFRAPTSVAVSAGSDSPVARVLGPNSLIGLIGEEHLQRRKLLLAPFHGERMRAYERTIVEAARRDMASWPIGEPMRFEPHARAITLEVILRAVFGVQEGKLEPMRAAIRRLLVAPSGLTLLRYSVRIGVERALSELTAAAAALDELIYEEIASRRRCEDLDERTDILSLMLQARDEEGEALTDAQLRDELVTLLVAGHDTTATSCAWVFERLVRHPPQLARVMDEIDRGESDDYLMAAINETLRLRPVVPRAGRRLVAPLTLGAYTLPAGTYVQASILLTNRSPRVYEEPAAFRPERFAGAQPETFSWIPFGGGIRRCIGAAFAQHEIEVIVRTVLSEMQPSRPPGLRGRFAEPMMRRGTTLAPGSGARIVWRHRARRSPGSEATVAPVPQEASATAS